MSEIITFYAQHGLPLTIIAVIGIVILGMLKYMEIFKKFEETKRHMMYIGISVLLSILGGGIYLLVTKNFEIQTFLLFVMHIFSLNQMFYNIFKATTFNDLMTKVFEKFLEFVKNI